MSIFDNSNIPNTNLPTDNLLPRVVVAVSADKYLNDLTEYCFEQNWQNFGYFVISEDTDNNGKFLDYFYDHLYSQEQQTILVVDHLNTLLHIHKELATLDLLLTKERLEIHLPLERAVIHSASKNIATYKWKMMVVHADILAQQANFKQLSGINFSTENNEEIDTLVVKIMQYINDYSSPVNDSRFPSSVIVTSCNENFIKLNYYCVRNNLKVVESFGIPEQQSIEGLVDYVKQYMGKVIVVIDTLDSLSIVYKDMAMLNFLLSEDKIEVHLPFEELIIRQGDFSSATMSWHLLAMLASSYSVIKPEVKLEVRDEDKIYRLVDEMMNKQFKISKSQEDKALDNIQKAISYVIVQDEVASSTLHNKALGQRKILLNILEKRSNNEISEDLYSRASQLLKEEVRSAINILGISLQNVTNFSEVVLDVIDIVLKGSKFYNQATLEKKRQILSLIFSKLEIVEGKLDFTIRPAFVEFFISLLPN